MLAIIGSPKNESSPNAFMDDMKLYQAYPEAELVELLKQKCERIETMPYRRTAIACNKCGSKGHLTYNCLKQNKGGSKNILPSYSYLPLPKKTISKEVEPQKIFIEEKKIPPKVEIKSPIRKETKHEVTKMETTPIISEEAKNERQKRHP